MTDYRLYPMALQEPTATTAISGNCIISVLQSADNLLVAYQFKLPPDNTEILSFKQEMNIMRNEDPEFFRRLIENDTS